mgnify:CR=1 FL=1
MGIERGGVRFVGLGGQHIAHRKIRVGEERHAECHEIVERQYSILNQEILPELSKHGIHLLRHQDRNAAQRAWVKDYFDREVRPLLTPIGLDLGGRSPAESAVAILAEVIQVRYRGERG